MPRRAQVAVVACVLACLACVLGASCAPYRNYTLPNRDFDQLTPQKQADFRRSIRPCTDLTEKAGNEEISSHCTLAIIEFDDQGEFWEPEQLDDTLELISQVSNREGGKALVVVFVHGWKNDASPKNEAEKNLGSFKKVLIQLAEEELHFSTTTHAERRPIVGIYMSWSGLTNTTPLLKQVSFFARKNAATRVARVSFSHAIHRIVARTKGTFSKKVGNPKSVAVVVGHSFGGLIVENTLLRSLTVETNDFAAYGADLTVLVNPANEAILARQSVHALAAAPPRRFTLRDADNRKQSVSLPLIVSVTSVADNATNGVFHLALSIKSLFKRFRTYEDHEAGESKQRFYYTRTPGHSTPEGALYSHDLTCPMTQGGVCSDAPKTAAVYEQMMAERKDARDEASADSPFPPPAVELGDCLRESETKIGVKCIDRLSFLGAATGQLYSIGRDRSSANQTGYWIMQIPATIVPDHSDIFQSELTSLLTALINLKKAHTVGSLEAAESYLEAAYSGN